MLHATHYVTALKVLARKPREDSADGRIPARREGRDIRMDLATRQPPLCHSLLENARTKGIGFNLGSTVKLRIKRKQ